MSRVSPTIRLDPLITRWEDAVVVRPGPICQATLAELCSKDFGQAPVLVGDRPIGIVSTDALKALHGSNGTLHEASEEIGRRSLDVDVAIDRLLEVIAAQRGAIVLAEDGGSPGFVTLSDLNRHLFRAALYPLVAELESGLASLVESVFQDPWEWLETLDKERQARLVGYWEVSKRDGVDIGPLAGAMLSELSTICEATAAIRKPLGFASRGDWCRSLDPVKRLRNGIMHPVRPLLDDEAGVATLRESIAELTRILGAIDVYQSRP